MPRGFTKKCVDCGRVKLLDQFIRYHRKDGKVGYGNRCQTCRTVFGREKYKPNPGKEIKRHRTLRDDLRDAIHVDIRDDELDEIMDDLWPNEDDI